MSGPANGTYNIINVGTGSYVDLALAYAVPYASIIAWGPSLPAPTNEQWVLTADSNGLYTIQSNLGANNIAFCSINSTGAEVINGNPTQNSKHQLVPVSGGYKIQVANTQLVWMHIGTDTADNRKIRVAAASAGVNDVWTFSKV